MASLSKIAPPLKELVITAGTDGHHMVGSKHYIGDALDIRISNLLPGQLKFVVDHLKSDLGKDYDVIVEVDHIHVEYDPKGKSVNV